MARRKYDLWWEMRLRYVLARNRLRRAWRFVRRREPPPPSTDAAELLLAIFGDADQARADLRQVAADVRRFAEETA